jgi:hypothetical protein
MASHPGAVKKKQDVVCARIVPMGELPRNKLTHLTDVSQQRTSSGRSKGSV